MATSIPIKERDTITQLQAAIKHSFNEGQKTRMRAIIYIKKGANHTETANEFVVNKDTVTNWIQRYNQGGIEALIFSKGGRSAGNPKWDTEPFATLAKEIDKGGYWSIPRMQEWITEQYQKDIPEQTVWYRMNQLNYSYKGARPHPVQGDRERQETFKKGVSLRSWSR